jgi:hypothetical protein
MNGLNSVVEPGSAMKSSSEGCRTGVAGGAAAAASSSNSNGV